MQQGPQFLTSIAAPASAGLLLINVTTATPKVRGFSLTNLWTWIATKIAAMTSAISTTSTIHADGTMDSTGVLTGGGGVVAGTGNATLLKKIINIGDWDMDTTQTVSVAHGLTLSKIRKIDVLIQIDAGTGSDAVYLLTTGNYLAPTTSGAFQADATNVLLGRVTGGIFDNSFFDSTGYNRGWITIEYTP